MIELDGVCIEVPGFTVADANLRIERGEFFCLLGHTGSGKSLLLEAIAGLMPIASGRIRLNGRDVTRLPPERRGIGIVYQDSALFPHLNVKRNIHYGLRHHGQSIAEAKPRLDRIMDLLDLHRLGRRNVAHLSGGERQRVALARALAVQPGVLLLDEPLTALDPNFREEVRRALKDLHREMGLTFLMVTHDFAEALYLAQRVAVIQGGRIRQVGDTQKVFRHPATPEVAAFLGMRNIFEAYFHNGAARFHGLECPAPGNGPGNDEAGYIALRPEDVAVTRTPPMGNGWVSFTGRVDQLLNLGFHFEVTVRVGKAVFTAFVTQRDLLDMGLREGDEVCVAFDPARAHAM